MVPAMWQVSVRVCMCLSVCLCVCVCLQVPARTEEGVRSPETGVQAHGRWDPNLGPLGQQCTLND